jgi:hypothetical protein
MKIGDLVYVNSTSTGDSPWVVELYRTKYPVVFVGEIKDVGQSKIFYKGGIRWLRYNQLKVIKT